MSTGWNELREGDVVHLVNGDSSMRGPVREMLGDRYVCGLRLKYLSHNGWAIVNIDRPKPRWSMAATDEALVVKGTLDDKPVRFTFNRDGSVTQEWGDSLDDSEDVELLPVPASQLRELVTAAEDDDSRDSDILIAADALARYTRRALAQIGWGGGLNA